MWQKIKHWWMGCAKYNQEFNTWYTDNRGDARCGICRNRCAWLWGYTTGMGSHLEADKNAQEKQINPNHGQVKYHSYP